MADEADIARDYEEKMRLEAIAARREECKTAVPTGACLNCGEAVEAPRRWCDADCRDEWEKEGARYE